MNKKAFIFDLDGVIVDTARYHFLAWKKNLNCHIDLH
jgi:beta-phosphoglucomutase